MTYSFQKKVEVQLQALFPTLLITESVQKSNLRSMFKVIPTLTITVGQLRIISESRGDPEYPVINIVAQKLNVIIKNQLLALENNEKCRQKFIENSSERRRNSRGDESKINIKQLQSQDARLKKLIVQAQHKVKSKSQLMEVIRQEHATIFEHYDDTNILRNIKEVYLLTNQENYEHVSVISENQYLILFEQMVQHLLIYQNVLVTYINNNAESTFRELQKATQDLVKSNTLTSTTKIDSLLKFILNSCGSGYKAIKTYCSSIQRMRTQVIFSICRAYYFCFMLKQDIDKMNNQIDKITISELARNSQPQRADSSLKIKDDGKLGRESNHYSGIEEISIYFDQIFSYLTERKQNIIPKLFKRKITKRIQSLLQIQERVTHINKLKFNEVYLQMEVGKMMGEAKRQEAKQLFFTKLKKLTEDFQELKPLSLEQFNLLFNDIQNLLIFLNQSTLHHQDYVKSIEEIEKAILQDYFLTSKGERKQLNNSFGILNRSSIKGDLSSQHVFDLSIESYLQRERQRQKSRLNVSRNKTINAVKIAQDTKGYLQEIGAIYGEQLVDVLNFRAYFIHKMIDDVEKALSATPESDSDIRSSLSNYLIYLRFIPSIIIPQINQTKLELIFYPKINSSLFSTLISMLKAYRIKIKQIYANSSNQLNSNLSISKGIKAFMQARYNFLTTLLQNIDKLEQISKTIGELNLNKNTFDVCAEYTENVVLKLLLAEKQIKAYLQALIDKKGFDEQSQKGSKLLSQFIYPIFIKSLSLKFEHPVNKASDSLLVELLNFCDLIKKYMAQSEVYLMSIISTFRQLSNADRKASTSRLLDEFDSKLIILRNQGEELIIEGQNKYSNLSYAILDRQIIKIKQFIEVAQKRTRVKGIVDDRARQFLNLLVKSQN